MRLRGFLSGIRSAVFAAALVAASSPGVLDAQRGGGPPAATPPAGGRGQASPASRRPPPTARPQQYPADQIETGRSRFAAQCGFCHGRDAAGGEGGSDLTRSELVAADVRGDKLRPFLRTGRPDKGMPAFSLPDGDVAAIVAFIHDQKTQAEAATGGRRAVDVADLAVGNAEAGKRYFDSACSSCHSPSGDLAGIATKFEGLALLQRMLYPGSGRNPGPAPAPPVVTVTLPTGQQVSGKLAFRDEFTIALTDADGWFRSWPARQVTYRVEDRLQAHVEQLGRYTDADMHNVLAYLTTLR